MRQDDLAGELDQNHHPFPSKSLHHLSGAGTESGSFADGERVPRAGTMLHNQDLPDGAPKKYPGVAQEGSETQRSRELPLCQQVFTGSTIAGETAGELITASAAPTQPHQQISATTSITSHSSAWHGEPATFNRMCAQRPRDPPRAGMKRKRSAHGGDTEGEGEEKSLFYISVRAVNGVSVTWETRTGFRGISKCPRLFKANYTGGESFAGSDQSSSHSRSELGDVDLEAEGSESGQVEEAAQQVIAGQKMSDVGIARLPTMQGLRCLACCHVFPSLEALIHHVKHGLHDGFSCRVFYRVLGQFRAEKKIPSRSQRLRKHARQPRRRICSRCGRAIQRAR